jgi:hypothetical protein
VKSSAALESADPTQHPPAPSRETAPGQSRHTAQPPSLPKAPEQSVAANATRQSYTVIAGETVNRKKMGIIRNKLKSAGLQPVVSEKSKEMEVFRLLERCFNNKTSAENRLSLVSRQIKDAFVISDGGSFCVVAGSLMSEKAALQAQTQLAQTGLPADIVKYRVLLPVWRISAGQYTDVRDAEQAAKYLAAQGIAATIDKEGI